jgi:asparagine synthase (glutamine-hydrolysing)
MCGIAGILTHSQPVEQIEPLLKRMQVKLDHRGPDDAGRFISDDRRIGLVHSRLAIIDISSSGRQPMSTPDGRYWITFNGEIYNYRSLRAQMAAAGEQFQSHSDTEVILKLYQRQGKHCVHELRGMFAFAIWDSLEKTCFLARDPLGIKPLYYWVNGSTLIFASELRAILATKLPAVKLSTAGLYGYLVSGSVPEPHTLIDQIHCLEAGHSLTWRSGECTSSQYWQIQMPLQVPSEVGCPSEAQARVRTALLDSIQHHFVSDVPVGVFLSGGIDSTAIVALASQTQAGPIRTYSISFAESAWNEGEVARKVAEHFSTEHTEFRATAAWGRELLPQFLAAIDQPSIDGFNVFCVSQVARQHGTKVVLSGLGGDELFSGYGSFQTIPKMLRVGNQMRLLSPLSLRMGAGLEQWAKSPQLRRIGDFLQQTPTSAAAFRSFRGIFSHREACAIARQYLPDTAMPHRQTPTLQGSFPSLQDEISVLELSRYMRNQLLRDSDVMSMAWGLELRVPMVDQVLVDTIAAIPSSLRLAAGKQLLVQAVPELPNWVVNRPKQGFCFPFEQWLTHGWQDYFSALDCPKSIPLNSWSRRWSLAMLQHWWQQISA